MVLEPAGARAVRARASPSNLSAAGRRRARHHPGRSRGSPGLHRALVTPRGSCSEPRRRAPARAGATRQSQSQPAALVRSSRRGPKINQPDRLHSAPQHLVALQNRLRLVFGFHGERRSALPDVLAVAFALLALVTLSLAELEGELLVERLVGEADLGMDDLSQRFGF